ncbi:hypothetical protein [Arthrobacter antioxidans]|uniref:hypothetical protein n=1 Tax=Arthrobacter antioxidans TaxID=2895818 RepID=UPI001FFFCEEB|nr:hypothetical protein [Arthrobacter antioxidans]
MGNRGKALIRTSVTVSAVLLLAACTGDTGEAERDKPSAVVSESTPAAAEPLDRLTNRLVGLTDLQGRPLYIVPEAPTRSHLEALTKQPLFERVYTPADCAPDEAFTPPPAGLEGVLGRSNLSDDHSRLGVEIYTAPDEAELVDYFIGADPKPLVRCTDFDVTVGDVRQGFSYTRVDAPPIAPHSQVTQYSVAQDGSTTHHLRVTAVDGLLAASVILSTVEPAGEGTTDRIMRLTQQAVS